MKILLLAILIFLSACNSKPEPKPLPNVADTSKAVFKTDSIKTDSSTHNGPMVKAQKPHLKLSVPFAPLTAQKAEQVRQESVHKKYRNISDSAMSELEAGRNAYKIKADAAHQKGDSKTEQYYVNLWIKAEPRMRKITDSLNEQEDREILKLPSKIPIKKQ